MGPQSWATERVVWAHVKARQPEGQPEGYPRRLLTSIIYPVTINYEITPLLDVVPSSHGTVCSDSCRTTVV